MANERRNRSDVGGVITRMCSISDSGLVFHSSDAIQVSSEIKMTIETDLLGEKNAWSVKGWVVECHAAEANENLTFEVTMLFSEIPQALRELLARTDEPRQSTYPPVPGAEMFGLN